LIKPKKSTRSSAKQAYLRDGPNCAATEPETATRIQINGKIQGSLKTMKTALARRKHVNLGQALNAMSDASVPTRDAMLMWRKALRRADPDTKALLKRVHRFQEKKALPGAGTH
jgi:hypothetical protein